MQYDVVTDGLKHDGGKPRLSLVPGEAIEAIGAVMTHGAEKYSANSWRQVAPERYRDALMRHVCKWLKDPHGLDDDSGFPHIWHIATNAAFLCVLDDKPGENANAYECTACGEEWYLEAGTSEENNMRFCPYCGAKMERGGE